MPLVAGSVLERFHARHRCQPDRSVVRYQRRGPACRQGTREIRERLPNTRVPAGRPGDTLDRLRELARASQDPGQ